MLDRHRLHCCLLAVPPSDTRTDKAATTPCSSMDEQQQVTCSTGTNVKQIPPCVIRHALNPKTN